MTERPSDMRERVARALCSAADEDGDPIDWRPTFLNRYEAALLMADAALGASDDECAFVDRFGAEIRTNRQSYVEIKFLREQLEIALDAIRSAERETNWLSGDGFDAESLADIIEARALWWCGASQTGGAA